MDEKFVFPAEGQTSDGPQNPHVHDLIHPRKERNRTGGETVNPRDGKGSPGKALQDIIRTRGDGSLHDRVGPQTLPRRPAQGAGGLIGTQESGLQVSQGRIGRTVGLASGLGGNRDGTGRDAENDALGPFIVGVVRGRADGDGVSSCLGGGRGTGRITGRANSGVGHPQKESPRDGELFGRAAVLQIRRGGQRQIRVV